MGEPAEPTPTERAWARDRARAIVDAVRNDESLEIARYPDSVENADAGIDGDVMSNDLERFKLAQEIDKLTKERDQARVDAANQGAAIRMLQVWADDRYDAEVTHRPLENRYKSVLHSTWTQVIDRLRLVVASTQSPR